MIRVILICAALWGGLNSGLAAQDLSAIARVSVDKSYIRQNTQSGTELKLHLSGGVPFRVFVLDNPTRLVLDFREVDWSGVSSDALLRGDSGVTAVRFGAFQPGWTRLVADLQGPMLPNDVAMEVDEPTGHAILRLTLTATDAADFAENTGVPDSTIWPEENLAHSLPPTADDRFVVIIDPGHGGIDPGAEREGLTEKELMLDMAFGLRDALIRAGDDDLDVVMTRQSDMFVSLESRVALAHQAKGDLFLSLHADALSQGGAHGATVYLLSDEASDKASAHLAARHNRADIIAGADLTGSDDEVTTVLLDLARQETAPRSEALAQSVIDSLTRAGGPMNSRPLRRAGFSVLKSADIPSVLVEVGFLSSKRDLENLRDPAWRQGMVAALARGVLDWREMDEARKLLVRQ